MWNWRRTSVAAALLLLPSATYGQLDVGDRLDSALMPKKNSGECGAGPSQFYPCVTDLTVSGVRFSVVGYDSKTKRVKYLSTFDEQFRTQEGLRVDDWIEMSEDQVVPVTSWFIYGPRTNDGWHIVLGDTLLGNEKVQFIDGTIVYPRQAREGPPRVGKAQIRGFEKGGPVK